MITAHSPAVGSAGRLEGRSKHGPILEARDAASAAASIQNAINEVIAAIAASVQNAFVIACAYYQYIVSGSIVTHACGIMFLACNPPSQIFTPNPANGLAVCLNLQRDVKNCGAVSTYASPR